MSGNGPTPGLPDSLPRPLLTQEKYQETVFETWDDGFDASYQGFSFFLLPLSVLGTRTDVSWPRELTFRSMQRSAMEQTK